MKYKRALLTFFALIGITAFLVVSAPEVSFADAKGEVCSGIGAATDGAGNCTGGGASVSSIIKTVVNILSWIVGVTAVIMIIIGGFMYVTSAGESGKASTARSTIIYAIIGLIIVAFAQTIVRFVLGKI